MPKITSKKPAATKAIPMTPAQAKAALEPPVPTTAANPATPTPPANGREGKVRRSARVQWTNGAFSLVSIWQESRPGSGTGLEQDYLVEKLGQGFWLLTKLDPTEKTTYVVFLGAECSCNCKGFRGHGHCKHVAGVDALISRGKLVP